METFFDQKSVGDSKQVVATAHIPVIRETLVHSRQEGMEPTAMIVFHLNVLFFTRSDRTGLAF